MSRLLRKNIDVTPEQWERVEKAAKSGGSTPNQLIVELAMEALERRGWPRTRNEVRLLRSSMFAAHALARDMIAAGRHDEVERIRDYISTVAPSLPDVGDESGQDHANPPDSVDTG